MPRPLGRVGDEDVLLRRRRVPEHLGDRPRPVGVVDQQPVAALREPAVGFHQGLGGGALQVGLGRRRVERGAEEVVRRGVAQIELDRRVEGTQFDQIDLAEFALLARRPGGLDFPQQFRDRPLGLDAEGAAVLAVEPPALEDDARRFHLGRLAGRAAGEDQFLAVIQPVVGELE